MLIGLAAVLLLLLLPNFERLAELLLPFLDSFTPFKLGGRLMRLRLRTLELRAGWLLFPSVDSRLSLMSDAEAWSAGADVELPGGHGERIGSPLVSASFDDSDGVSELRRVKRARIRVLRSFMGKISMVILEYGSRGYNEVEVPILS
jgi:hypothetical protein